MFCKNCGAEMNENQAICLRCGVKTGEGSTYCHNCGNQLAPNADVCMGCGVAVKNNKSGNLACQDKIVIILVCLFLGGIGIHNFMMGEAKKGIFKIIMYFLCGLGGIFALIDLVKICMGTYTVDSNKLV